MTSDREALLAAICANPDDDTPRLVYADWLDEAGQSERAEFVRLQVEFSRLHNDGSDSQAVYEFIHERDQFTRLAANWERIDAGVARRIAVNARLETLGKEHGPAWFAELPVGCGVNWIGFRRGFGSRAEVTAFGLLASSADTVMATVPSVELVCRELTGDQARTLIDAGLLPWIRGLELHGDYIDGLRELSNHPDAVGIRSLVVRARDGAGGAQLAEILAGSRHWAGLETLDVGLWWFEASPAEVLFRAAHLRGLSRLRLWGSAWSPDTVRAFADTAFPNLLDLRFSHSGLDDDAAEVLADIPTLRTLRYLDLGRNRIGGRGAAALLASPHLVDLAFLGLEYNPIRRLPREDLRDAPAGALRLFHAHGCQLGKLDVGALARSPRMRQLWYLDLDANALEPGTASHIVRGFQDRCPPVIWLTANRLNDDDAVAFAYWPAAESLRVLQLSQTQITDFGMRALLNSPHLTNLDGLGVPHPTEPLAAAIRARFHEHGRME